jgi:glyoxylase-like metal-dependent hydrolase (beta-lactamase superfamily II)/rhodanese-related sulfurtransferase
MKIEQIYTGCLSQAAYYIESNGEAAIIDPLRDIDFYVNKINAEKAQLKYIFETHFHADFVSGHLDLKKATNAKIIYGPKASASFDFTSAQDGDVFSVGKIKIKVLHTPGHTLESSCFLLIDEAGIEHALFTGDTLFLGDVGRPDLAVSSNHSAEELASMLYDSLHSKILPLNNQLIIYPGHGAGSACGKNLSKETIGKLGEQKKSNYALKAKTKIEFIRLVLQDQNTAPEYFPMNAQLNQKGYPPISKILKRGQNPLSPIAFKQLANQVNALIIDTRCAGVFSKGFIPKSINIGLGGQFASWMATLNSDLNQPILIVAEPGTEEESITRLTRVGFNNLIGFLEGGFISWKKEDLATDSLFTMSAIEFSKQASKVEFILDVRNEKEFISEHLLSKNLHNIPLDKLHLKMEIIPRQKEIFIHCAGGYRSSIAASLLKAHGIHNIIDITGGFAALKKTHLSLSKFVCPSTL